MEININASNLMWNNGDFNGGRNKKKETTKRWSRETNYGKRSSSSVFVVNRELGPVVC